MDLISGFYRIDCMNQIKVAAGLVFLILCTGCVTSREQQMANARSEAQTVVFSERPNLYRSLAQRGKLSPEAAQTLQTEWQEKNKERQKLLASMTPSQRATYELQEQQIALQQLQIKIQEEQYKALKGQVAASGISSQQPSYSPSGGLVPIPQPQTQIVYPATHTMPRVAPYIYAR